MIELRKAHELDVVELTEDLPKYGVHRGARGTVVEVFDTPEEAYMVEFLEKDGEISKIADWILPSQIENVDQKADLLFRKGMNLLNQNKSLEAAEHLRQAFSLKPALVRLLHNIISKLAEERDWVNLMSGMRFIIDLEPTYELAWNNLAVAYLNYGVQRARENYLQEALSSFLSALRIETIVAIQNLARENIAAAYVGLGIEAHKKGDFEAALIHMQSAYVVVSNAQTRSNLALAYSILAEKSLRSGDYDAAISNYTAAEESGMLTSEGLNNRAIAHVHRMEIDQAIEALQTSIAIDPANIVAQQNLALLKRNLPDIQVAVIKSLQTEPTQMEFNPLPQSEPVAMSSLYRSDVAIT